MSKAITGAALLAGAIAIGAVAFEVASGGLASPALLAVLTKTAIAAGLTGLSMEAGAIATALTANRGMGITTRQPASARQIIYGTQRVGGIIVYQSTTGSQKDQYNFVIVLATHQIAGIEALYLDGRLVYFDTSSGGSRTYNGITFGGSANGNTYTGPNGVQYNFGGLVYCEMRDGTQAPGDVISGLTANDPSWEESASGSPYLGGCAYVYLKIEYNTTMFPQLPEIRFTVKGKLVNDPRTGVKAYSSNAALVAADWASDITYGLGLQVNQTQLIASANVCDEQIATATQGNESQFACHYHFDTGTAPSDAYATILRAMAGRRAMIGGEEYIWPAYWQGPSASFDESLPTDSLQWQPSFSFKDLCNRVTGTYTVPNYPYNIAGDLYDSNGFYDGEIQNNFQFGFQPSNFPMYAADPQHGYAADEYLNEDSGVTAAWASGTTYAQGAVVSYVQTVAGSKYASVWTSLANANTGNTPGPGSAWWANSSVLLPRELNLNMVLSVVQAQRLAKIELLRSRYQGRGTFELGLAAMTMQELDVMSFTFPVHGWVSKTLEILGTTFRVVTRAASEGQQPPPPEYRVTFDLGETNPSVYEWSVTEEQTIYDVQALPQQQQLGPPAPPTGLSLTTSAATAVVALDGTVTPRIEAQWTTPQDAYVTEIQIMHQLTGAASWVDDGTVDVSLNLAFISGVVANQTYSVRVRSRRANGAVSAWAEVDGFTVGGLISGQTALGLDPGSLQAASFADGTSQITCNPFAAPVGQLLLSLFPGGPVVLTTNGTIGGSAGSLQQQTLYWVYYVDPSSAGGNVTPIATTNMVDFIGKAGYFLIGSVVTPFGGSGGTASTGRVYPSGGSDSGTLTTSNPQNAYDGNLSTNAVVGGYCTVLSVGHLRTAFGSYTWNSFSGQSSTSDRTLNIWLSASITNTGGASGGSVVVKATVGTTTTTVVSLTSNAAATQYTVDVPAGTDPATVSVSVTSTPGGGSTAGAVSTVNADIEEIYIQ